MSPDQPLSWAPNLEDAIDRHPFIVPPTTLLAEVLTLISQAHHQSCMICADLALSAPSHRESRASCVLVMNGSELLGILTERDVVRLIAKNINFSTVTVSEVMAQPVITLPPSAVQDIFAALFLFRRYRIRHLPIVDDRSQLVGVISHENIRQVLRPANLLRFRRVSDVMSTQVVQASLTTTVLRVAQLMAEHRVSCVVITQRDEAEHDCPVGIVTERDLVQFQALQMDLDRTQVQRVMSTPLFLLSPTDSLWTAHQEMQRRRVGRLVVAWNWGQDLGIVTQTSLLRVFDPMEMYGVIENLQQTIQQLESEKISVSLQNQLADAIAPQSTVDRPNSPVLLNKIQSMVEMMMTDLDLPIEHRQALLRSVLELLSQLGDRA
ncbi:MAG: CBS domain-containing protein [Alkalinema sp. RU_4_3]|nr:CBS domain-containing protein [Alkalinema sp. RU_4_3]